VFAALITTTPPPRQSEQHKKSAAVAIAERDAALSAATDTRDRLATLAGNGACRANQ